MNKGESMSKKTLKEIIKELEQTHQCNCDLDNWQPQTDTGHSWVCRIDKIARMVYKTQKDIINK